MLTAEFIDSLEKSACGHLDDLVDWLKIPSISSDRSHRADVHRAAEWLVQKFQSAGLDTELMPTSGHPLVLAETPAVPGAPVVVVYGHYDVQPPEPLSEWVSPPFQPEIRDGNLYARGATDDKGQLLTHVQSVCHWLAGGQPLPLQVKFLIEGEEEVGSGSLEQMLPDLRQRLACDCVVISDSSQYADGQPAITYGLKGIATYELQIAGPSQDLHSGTFGGTVMNPAVALSHVLSALVDGQGRIQIPGFYRNVRPLSDEERQLWHSLPHDDEQFAKAVGVDKLFGETGFTTDERRWGRPTFDINGLTSGHQGEGVKTIIPATASAKFSFRLVPDQNPQEVTAALEAYVQQRLPVGVRWTLKPGHGAPAMVADTQSPFIAAAKQAIEGAFGTPPVLIREGGSIPIVARFQEVLQCDCLLLGWGLNDDNLHSPNEKFRVADYHRGIKASALLWDAIGKLNT